MRRSIQWTLQLWHAGLLAVVLIGFGTASYFGVSRWRFQQLDAELERSVQLLVTGFRPPKQRNASSDEPIKEERSEDESSTPPSTQTQDDDDHATRKWEELPTPTFHVPAALEARFADGQSGNDYYVVWDREGRIIDASNNRAAAEVPYPGTRPTPSAYPPKPSLPTTRSRSDFRESYINGPLWTKVLVGTSTVPTQTELRHVAFLLIAAGAGVLVIGLVGGWLVSLRAVRPIRAITQVAQEISVSNLSRRIQATEIQSELGSLAAVLNEMFARLDAAFQHQVRFTADASHELRTPLSVIHTHVQLALSRERSASEYRKTLETCLRASARMKDLVDSLLLLAGADAGRLTLNPEPLDFQTTMENCLAMVAPLAEAKGVTVEADLRPVTLTADPSRMAQVATNLLTNAIRYNREGGRVRVSLDTDGGSVVLTIADTGLGIPPEHQPHIFERFYRVDKARSREEGGSGLGLAICKTIVESHGGTITFQSELGQGTTFVVRLPCAPSA